VRHLDQEEVVEVDVRRAQVSRDPADCCADLVGGVMGRRLGREPVEQGPVDRERKPALDLDEGRPVAAPFGEPLVALEARARAGLHAHDSAASRGGPTFDVVDQSGADTDPAVVGVNPGLELGELHVVTGAAGEDGHAHQLFAVEGAEAVDERRRVAGAEQGGRIGAGVQTRGRVLGPLRGGVHLEEGVQLRPVGGVDGTDLEPLHLGHGRHGARRGLREQPGERRVVRRSNTCSA
jgi:hypothetical protein